MSSPINYPPKKVIEPIFGKINFELVILWMLNNNEVCTWSNLKELIKPSTLSIYLKKLLLKKLIEKKEFNQYTILTKGQDRYYELSQATRQKRKLNYPPKAILWKRNYDHWILWMVYNNTFCKWADFLNEPLSINNSSLSKNMNVLIEEEFIKKENKEYRITQLGKSQYSVMLRDYDLDRQSILEEESKRIKEDTKKTLKFFKKYRIIEDETRFRFLNNLLRLPYEKIKQSLENEEDYFKILLYLSLNHPSQYPTSISTKKFANKYGLELVVLEFHVLQIVERKIFPIKFFKLEGKNDEVYFFQANEKLERMLNAVVEEHITKFTYLNKLYEEEKDKTYSITLESTIDAILDEVCVSLFQEGQCSSLKKLLPRYIAYLAYKVEKEKKLFDTYDKLKGLIWHEVQAYSSNKYLVQEFTNYKENIKKVTKAISLNPDQFDTYVAKERVLIYFNKYDELLAFLDEMLEKFPDEEKDIKIKVAYILKEKRNVEEGLNIINELLEKYSEDTELLTYKAYWLQYLNQKEEAIDIIQNLIEQDPDNHIYHDTYGEMLMSFQDYEGAKIEFLKAIEISSEEWYTFQTHIKLGICYKELGKFKLAVERLESGIKYAEKSKSDLETKNNWLTIANLFKAEIAELESED
ncbi:MAG: tetratricopeptide repeat protein [Promethearchaeota archaeon]